MMKIHEKIPVWVFPTLKLIAVVLLYWIDVRDLYHKVYWLGPTMSYGYTASATQTFDSIPLASTANLSVFTRGDQIDFVSGWPSFLSRCESLRTTKDRTDVHTMVATDCQVGLPSNSLHFHQLVLSASVRVDSIAWSCCKLLLSYRRPPICQENLVTGFTSRYRLPDPILASNQMAIPNSDAENEIQALLLLLSKSYPLQDVVCVEGFQITGPGKSSATVFGCASPNNYDAAFVGTLPSTWLTGLRTLQQELSWLTLDRFTIMGLDLIIRQNAQSTYNVLPAPDEQDNAFAVHLVHTTDVNFSSFGPLYVALLIIDLILLVVHFRSLIETTWMVVLPLITIDMKTFERDYSYSILYHSLYRSKPIMILTILSSVLSWQLYAATSFVLTWDEAATGRFDLFLGHSRVWMLVIVLLNLLWSGIVRLHEKIAYRVAQQTFISTFEILGLVSIIALMELKSTGGNTRIKYNLEQQRQVDQQSFHSTRIVANAFNEELEYRLWTSGTILHLIYSSMNRIVLESLLLITLILVLKMVYYRMHRSRSNTLIDAANIEDEEANTKPRVEYEVLPLEELLQVPMRAQALVRPTFSIQISNPSHVLYLPPSLYLEFGLIIDDQLIRPRCGFVNVIQLKVDVAKYFLPDEHPPISPRPALQSVKSMRQLNSPPSGMAQAMSDAVLATDTGAKKEMTSTDPNRKLSETTGSPAARSMRRRKSTTELLMSVE